MVASQTAGIIIPDFAGKSRDFENFLSSFPSTFYFPKTITLEDADKQIGNSVTVPVIQLHIDCPLRITVPGTVATSRASSPDEDALLTIKASNIPGAAQPFPGSSGTFQKPGVGVFEFAEGRGCPTSLLKPRQEG